MKKGKFRFLGISKNNCNHVRVTGIYGDAINHNGGMRAMCLDCGTMFKSLPKEKKRK